MDAEAEGGGADNLESKDEAEDKKLTGKEKKKLKKEVGE